ncbi:MAG: hypothetical protein K6E83_13295 [Clostridium sp.]|nr:hypothetical protein [Clostridium sp.]
MKADKTTGTLTEILKGTKPEEAGSYLSEYSDELLEKDRPFAAFMRKTLKAHGLRQQEAFLAADISEGYGYKLLAEEKHTRQRDTVLRLCLGGRFTLTETQRALKICGMSPLYPRSPRDAVLIIALNTGIYRIPEVNALLEEHGMEPLRATKSAEE